MPKTQGDNFGLNDNYDYYEIEFDSKDTQNTLEPPDTSGSPLANGINQNHILNWPLFTIGRPLQNIAAMKIIAAEIPFSYYVVTEANGTFLLLEGAFPDITLTIPPGNYTSGTLAAELQSLLNSLTNFTASVAPQVYTVTFDNSLGKFRIVASKTTSQDIILSFGTIGIGEPGFTNPRYVLGMAGGFNPFIPVATNPPEFPGVFNNLLVAPFAAQITGPNYLYINSSLQGQQVSLYLPDGSFTKGQLGPQMCKVPVNVNPGEVIFYEDPDPQKWFNVEDLVNIYNIDLYCTLGNTPQKIDFNGVSFSVKLGILTIKTAHVDQQSGLTSEGRVFKRMYGS